MASGSHRGLPILSGEPPRIESESCVDCGKDFNPLWRRPHACKHCGYSRCSSCASDGQALMPREGGGGYDVESVCVYCLGMLQVTAASLPTLRALPVKRLKEYLAAYDIPCVGPKEKEDFVQAIVKARNPLTGCLSPEKESYFRRKSVPRKGIAPLRTKATPPRTQTSQATRPMANGNDRPPPQQPRVNPNQYRPPPPEARPPPPRSVPTARPSPQTRPPPARPTPAPKAPPLPVPTILSLVPLPTSYLHTLSIGTLKAVLFENHVRVDFKQVLEKDELVARVSELIRDERNRLERQRLQEEREARGLEPVEVVLASDNGDVVGSTPVKAKVPTGPVPDLDRGLCVVCQDEEAVLAVVDCGHLAMCATCSELIMATSRECPLCRTRIVTDQRLIRIYRT